MKVTDITNALNRLVQYMDGSNQDSIDTFVFIDNPAQLQESNYGATMQDYKDGYYWSRAFVNAGATEGNLCVKRPVLFLEQGNTKIDSINKDGECETLFLTVGYDRDCIDCKEKRSLSATKVIAKSMIRSIIKEIAQISKYKQDGADVWLLKSEYEKLSATGADVTPTGQTVLHHIQDRSAEIYYSRLGSDNLITYTVRLEICGCDTDDLKLDLEQSFGDGLAVAGCETC